MLLLLESLGVVVSRISAAYYSCKASSKCYNSNIRERGLLASKPSILNSLVYLMLRKRESISVK
jgi:hypothetical protein